MIDVEEIILFHDDIISQSGGDKGLLSRDLLESALARPFHGLADGTEFYPGDLDKAAALLHGIATNHAFVDGNKRTAYSCAGLYLERQGRRLIALPDEIVAFMVEVGAGKRNVEGVRTWLEARTTLAPIP